MRVELLSAADEPLWEAFVSAHRELPVYYTLAYRKLLLGVVDGAAEYRVAVTADGSVAGILPLFARNGPFGEVVNSLPFYGSHGGIVADGTEARAALLEAYHDRIGEPQVVTATVVGNPFAAEDGLAGLRSDVSDRRIAQYTPLDVPGAHDDPDDGLMASYHQKTRNLVRKGARQGFTVEVENDAWQLLRRLHEQTMTAVGRTPKPASFYGAVATALPPGTGYRIYVARERGEPVAALLNLYHGDFVEYFMPVIVNEHRERQPLSLIVFRAMADAARDGYRVWNWGGTWPTQDGLYQFKRRWGTLEKEYRYAIAVNDPAVMQRTPAELTEGYPLYFAYPYHLLAATA